jgi:hypothetical protein
MYRDYFQTDIENDHEDDHFDDEMDRKFIAATGEMDPSLFDFQDYTHKWNPHEDFSDIVE